jgi:hypothetical protein
MAITRENHLLFPNSERLSSGMGVSCQSVPHSGQCEMSENERGLGKLIIVFGKRRTFVVKSNGARKESCERCCCLVYFFAST